jgi:hypothetical protein
MLQNWDRPLEKDKKLLSRITTTWVREMRETRETKNSKKSK